MGLGCHLVKLLMGFFLNRVTSSIYRFVRLFLFDGFASGDAESKVSVASLLLRLRTTKDKLSTVALYQDRLQSVSFLSFRGVKGFVIEEQRLAKE